MSDKKNRNYMATFILDSRGVESSIEELIESYGSLIKETAGNLESTDPIGNLEFARKTQNGLPNGIFVQYRFSGTPKVPEEIQNKVRLDRKVNRVMVEKV
jgi:ribosomal protein S6